MLTHDYDLIALLPLDLNNKLVNPKSHRTFNVESTDSKTLKLYMRKKMMFIVLQLN